jgi:hypothetical protein
MATEFVPFRLNGYVADWDLIAKATPIPGRFSRAPNMTDAIVASILAAIDAVPVTPTAKSPCAPPAAFTSRKLKFTFQTGGSVSFPVAVRANALSLATSLKTILTPVGAIACIELIGEKWERVDEILRPAGITLAAGPDVRAASGSKNAIYSASISYNTDTGIQTVRSVKMNTNSVATPALPFSGYADAIAAGLGALLPKGCGGTSNIEARHYTVTMLTTDVKNPIRKMIIPVASFSTTVIRAVGVQIATVAQTMCLAYEGESDSRFSRLVS